MLLIGDGKRKHAVEPLDAGLAVLFVGVDDSFGVGVRAEPVTACLEVAPELVVVVDFAVEDNPGGSIFVGHRLVAAGAVDDRQAAMAECVPGRASHGPAVRAAVNQPVRHRIDRIADGRG